MKHGLNRDRLSVVTAALLLAMALLRVLEAPGRVLQLNVLGSPLGVTFSPATVMLLIIAGLAVSGTELLLREHGALRERAEAGESASTAMFWIVPVLLSLALAIWLNGLSDLGLWALGRVAAAVLVPLALAAEYATLDVRVGQGGRMSGWLQWSYAVLVHLTALLGFMVVYGANLRGLLAGPLVFAGAGLLVARLLWPLVGDARRALLYGVVAGVGPGEMVWVLNYWPLSALQGGLVLLILFYVVVGLLQQWLLGTFNRRVVLEYSGVAVVAVVLVLVVAG